MLTDFGKELNNCGGICFNPLTPEPLVSLIVSPCDVFPSTTDLDTPNVQNFHSFHIFENLHFFALL